MARLYETTYLPTRKRTHQTSSRSWKREAWFGPSTIARLNECVQISGHRFCWRLDYGAWQVVRRLPLLLQYWTVQVKEIAPDKRKSMLRRAHNNDPTLYSAQSGRGVAMSSQLYSAGSRRIGAVYPQSPVPHMRASERNRAVKFSAFSLLITSRKSRFVCR